MSEVETAVLPLNSRFYPKSTCCWLFRWIYCCENWLRVLGNVTHQNRWFLNTGTLSGLVVQVGRGLSVVRCSPADRMSRCDGTNPLILIHKSSRKIIFEFHQL